LLKGVLLSRSFELFFGLLQASKTQPAAKETLSGLAELGSLADVEASEDEGFPCVLLMGFHHQKRGRVKLKLNPQQMLRFQGKNCSHFGSFTSCGVNVDQ
jgi:hypothetical protein